MNSHWTVGQNFSVEYATAAEAKAAVESTGQDGYIVCWVRNFDGRCQSTRMVAYRDGNWAGVNIHG